MKEAMAKHSLLLILAVALFSCSPIGKHPRKKLPAMLDNDCLTIVPSDSMAAMPSAISWLHIMEGSPRKKLAVPTDEWGDLCPPANSMHADNQAAGEQTSCNIAETTVAGKSYYSVQLFNAANDAAIIDLVQFYRPFAGSIIGMLLQDGKEGALIDCSSPDGHGTERAEFVVKNEKGQSFSVVFAWDRLSAGRASLFMNELQQSAPLAAGQAGITTTRVDNNKKF